MEDVLDIPCYTLLGKFDKPGRPCQALPDDFWKTVNKSYHSLLFSFLRPALPLSKTESLTRYGLLSIHLKSSKLLLSTREKSQSHCSNFSW